MLGQVFAIKSRMVMSTYSNLIKKNLSFLCLFLLQLVHFNENILQTH